MKKRKRVISILVAIMLLGNCCIPTNAQVKERTKGKNYIVLLNKSGDVKKLKSNYDIEQKEHSSVLEKQNMACAILNDKEKTALESDENVLCIEEDANIRALSIKSKKELKKAINKKVKPSYSWNVEIINADDKINNSIENRVKVAVIDSGMDATEAFDVKRHINFVDEENSVAPIYEDRTGHGTSIAGIIAGNGNGLKGINPNAELYSLKVLDENNQSTISRVVEAIYWCIDNDINIINMSFGTTVNSEILHNAIMEAYDRGILMIAAAGNSGTAIHYPAAYAEVMAVGSINSNNKISEYSCESKDIEILAPGEKVETYGGFGGYIVATGTSMAVPHVVGIASILWERDITCDSHLIRKVIDASARKTDSNKGIGIVDLEYALEIYDDVKKSYELDETIEVPKNRNELKNYDTEGYIEGQWAGSAHTNSIDKGYTMGDMGALSPQLDVSLIRTLVPKADDNYNGYDFRSVGALHGAYNYVADLKYIFNVARRVKNGTAVDQAIKDTTYSDLNYTSGNGEKAASVIVSEMNGAIKAIAKSGSTNAEKCQCILSLAFHLAGDIYAHESIVPKTSIDLTETKGESLASANIIVSENFFNLKQFTTSNYNTMKGLIQNGRFKFSKIKDYMKDGYVSGKYYDDNVNFYSSRYNRATSWAIAAMLNDMYYYNDWFSAWTLVPELYLDNGYGIKRFKLYTMVQRCKLTVSAEEESCIKSVSVE